MPMISLVRPTVSRCLLTVALAVSLVGGAFEARARLAPDALVLPGLRLGGEVVPATIASEADLRTWAGARTRAREGRHLTLARAGGAGEAGDGKPVDEGTLADFGVRVDEDATVAQLLDAGRARDLLDRLDRRGRARRGEIDVPFVIAIDARAVKERIARLKVATDTPPVSARLDFDAHGVKGVIDEVPGRYLDAEGAVSAITRAATRDAPEESVAILPVAEVAPRFTRARVEGLDVHALLATYETYFSRTKDQARRGQNIDVAAAKLDGLVVMPGELFSFNDAVGDRSPENGFQRSWEIHKGEMVEGVGGGTCQVASTLYAAAFFAGLDVLERLPHSRPSAYIPMGLDATVVYPDVDLKLRSPYDFPIAVHATVDGNKLRVDLLGAARPVRSVEFTREILEALPYDRKVEEDARLRGTMVRVKQHGIAGYQIKRTRVISLAGGAIKREETNDSYPPTAEIDEVPVGFDEALLPGLPGTPVVSDDSGPSPPVASAVAPAVVFIEAPGAHAPTKAQASPPRLLTLRR